MTSAGTFGAGRRFQGCVGTTLGGRRRLPGRLRRRLSDGVSEGKEVIRSGLGWCGGHREAKDFPAPGHRQGPGVLAAQVIAVRFGVGGQGSEDRC